MLKYKLVSSECIFPHIIYSKMFLQGCKILWVKIVFRLNIRVNDLLRRTVFKQASTETERAI